MPENANDKKKWVEKEHHAKSNGSKTAPQLQDEKIDQSALIIFSPQFYLMSNKAGSSRRISRVPSTKVSTKIFTRPFGPNNS